MNAPASFDTDLVPLYADHLATMKRRADEALARGGFDHLVVPSGTQHWQVFDDRDYPYAVNPQFKAWLPLTRLPYSWLVYTPGERPKVIYYQPFDYWHVVPDAPSGWWVDHCDIHIIRTPDEAAALLPPAARSAILGEPQSTLGDHAPNNPEPVIQYLEYQRSYKTPYEIALMRQAQRLAVRGHRAAEAAFRAGESEFGIHMAYCTAVGQDANDLPYGNIIGLNEHAAVLHYMELQRVAPDPLRSFLIDAGASFHGYASDITRSYAYDTGSEFQAMIDAVDAAQQKMCAGVRSGVDYRQLHVDAHHTLMGILKEFGRHRRQRGVLPARPGPSHRPTGARRGRFRRQRSRWSHRTPGRPPLPAHDPCAGTGHGRHHRTRPVFHRPAAGGGEEERPHRQRRLGARRCVPPLRRHPHRG